MKKRFRSYHGVLVLTYGVENDSTTCETTIGHGNGAARDPLRKFGLNYRDSKSMFRKSYHPNESHVGIHLALLQICLQF